MSSTVMNIEMIFRFDPYQMNCRQEKDGLRGFVDIPQKGRGAPYSVSLRNSTTLVSVRNMSFRVKTRVTATQEELDLSQCRFVYTMNIPCTTTVHVGNGHLNNIFCIYIVKYSLFNRLIRAGRGV